MDKVMTKREFSHNIYKAFGYLKAVDRLIITNKGVEEYVISKAKPRNVATKEENVATIPVNIAIKYPEASKKLSDAIGTVRITPSVVKEIKPTYSGCYGCGCSRTDKILCNEHGRY